MMARRIRTKCDTGIDHIRIGGFLDNKRTYVWLDEKDCCLGIISGQKLYRLARAIVKQFEK